MTNPQQTIILAIDCGSTNFKAAVFDHQLQRLAEASAPVEYLIHTPQRAELDAELIWQKTIELITNLCDHAGITTSQITTISLTSQAQTFTYLNDQNQPLMPFISWLDQRGSEEAQFIQKQLSPLFHHHCSFPTPNQLQLTKMLWTQKNVPGLLTNAAHLVSLPGFIIRKLGGPNLIDRNLAAMSGLLSLQSGQWWPQAIQLLNIPTKLLPEIIDVGQSIHVLSPCPDIPLSPDLTIVSAGNDQTAGAYANQAHDGTVIVTLGTALVAYRFAGTQPGPYAPDSVWGPYPSGGFYELAVSNFGCEALDWAHRQILPQTKTAEFFAAAQQIDSPTDDLPLFYPHKIAQSDPWTTDASVPQKAFTTLEGIAFNLRKLINSELGIKSPPSLSVTGGGNQSPFWLQMIADILDCPVNRAPGDSLLGAAAMAKPQAIAHQKQNENTIKPNPKHADYQQRYQRWLKNL
ncbi:MAG: FGGY-family carbohydrate kinase [Sedimentisphaerales bacterium]|nr:FGGY-family carbohydrate kinase [Sedimentisphaerales bacterium]